MAHTCDPDPDPRGGLVTRRRVFEVLVEGLKFERGDWLAVFGEVVGCPACLVAFTGTLAGLAASLLFEQDQNVLMKLEMELAALAAELPNAESAGCTAVDTHKTFPMPEVPQCRS